MQKALYETPVPVAKMLHYCDDQSILGVDFYIMEFVDGVVYEDPALPGLTNRDREKVFSEINRGLSSLHKVDISSVGLSDFGADGNYYERQISRWEKQWHLCKQRELPEINIIINWLNRHIPNKFSSSIVHGDYRLGNLIYTENETTIQAVLDWELCTLGDPLADLGYVLNNWQTLDEVPEPGEGDQAPTAVGGFFSRDEFLGIYANKTGRDLSNINYYRAFSHWRLAAIGQGVYKRYLVGAMGSERDMDLEKQKKREMEQPKLKKKREVKEARKRSKT
mgnify:CR=1 FL=1